MANSGQGYSVLLIGENPDGKPVVGNSDLDAFTLSRRAGIAAGRGEQAAAGRLGQRTTSTTCSGSARSIDGDALPGGRRQDDRRRPDRVHAQVARARRPRTSTPLPGPWGSRPRSPWWAAALLAQAAATTVLKPVHRLGVAARRLGEGKLDTRLRVSGTDELAELSRTFNSTAASLEKKVADMSAREESSRRFVADMSHELRTPLTAITAVTEVLGGRGRNPRPDDRARGESGGQRDAPAERPGREPHGGHPLRRGHRQARPRLRRHRRPDHRLHRRPRLAGRRRPGRRARHHGPRRPAPPGRHPGQPDRERPQARRLPGARLRARGVWRARTW